MEKVKHFFSSNLPWKILSVVLGFLFWLIGMNISNPVMTQVINVELELLNTNYIENANLTLLNYDDIEGKNISVNVKGTRENIDSLRGVQDTIKAQIDFKPANITNVENVGKDVELMIDIINNSNDLTILNLSPKNVKVEFDRVVTEDKEVVVHLLGIEQNRYVSENVRDISPATISVTGPETIINTIDEISASIDVSQATQTFTEQLEVKAVDGNGRNVVNDIKLSQSFVNATIDVSQGSTVRVLEPTLVGETAENIEIVSLTYEPNTVKVVGDEQDIQDVRYITLDDIDISEISETSQYKFDVRPILSRNNLTVESGTPYEVTVNIEVSYLDMVTYRYYLNDILIQGMNEQITGPSYVDISFVGDEEIISTLTKEDIVLSLDLRNVEEGINTIPVKSTMPEGISFLDSVVPTVEFYYEIELEEEETVQEVEEIDVEDDTSDTTNVEESNNEN